MSATVSCGKFFIAAVMMLSLFLLHHHQVSGIQTCTNLNAVAEAVNSKDYIQYIVDQQPIDEYYTAYVSRNEDVDYNTMNVSRSSSWVMSTLLQSDSDTYIIADDTLLPYPNVTFVGISNVITTKYLVQVNSDYKYHSDIETMGVVASSPIVQLDTSNILSDNQLETVAASKSLKTSDFPILKDDVKVVTINHTAFVSIVPFLSKQSVNFAILDINSTTLPVPSYNQTLGAFSFVFPSDLIINEPIYDINGTVIGQQNHLSPSAVSIESIPSVQDSTNLQKLISVRILSLQVVEPEKFGSKVNIDAVVTLVTQGSLKFIRYNIQTDSDNTQPSTVTAKPVAARVIMPKVDANNLPLGAKILFKKDVLYTLMTISRDQQKAFENLHGVKLDFDPSQDVAPFLLIVNINTGAVATATNLGKKLLKTSRNYATDFAFSGEDDVIIVGNSEDITYESGVEEYKNVQSFYVYYSHNSVVAAGYFGNSLFIKRDTTFIHPASEANLRFIALATSFAIDQVKGKFVVGGYVTDFAQPWLSNGRLSLVQFNTTSLSIEILYNMQVAYDGSNQVRIIRNAIKQNPNVKGGNPAVFNAALSMHGPTTPPPANPIDDKFRNVASGFWQMDCEPINYELANDLTYAFYAVFSVVVFIMAVIVITCSAYGFYLCIKDCRKGDEYSKLIE
ncbi:hypothetical protein FDP41_000574 [Naegleria fowleri]|uniref:Uncharacterized protein n=1 Tax=Naegleria fowleri TaxID=5763 RepID=A0A6A5CHB1_NAEFO|nr:uncharacterized protein FDP41_000574 [Naegleria fowleri]KAF0984675.1 hypothetical protein FDP41_000574 [Naegleria fowleri]CAG4708627.1 unnamed protein product [Naegleria fowleri]